MAARSSFSNDSRIVKMPLPKSVLLKDYLLDDLSSCSSNGFRSYPRRQCCTKVRYLIEIDLNKHIKLPPTQKHFLKKNSKQKHKSKSSSVLHKASNIVVNVFKQLQLSKRSFWNKPYDRKNKEFKRLNSLEEPIRQKVTSKSSLSSESYFTTTSDSSTTGTGGSLEINVAQNDKITVTTSPKGKKASTTTTTGAKESVKKEAESEKKEQFTPISVMDFSFDNDNDEDEVTSPFQPNHVEGSKRKLMPKVQRIKSLSQIKPVRLEDRITLSESRMHNQQNLFSEENQTEKKAVAMLQLLKTTVSSNDIFEYSTMESMLLGYFKEQIIDGNISNYAILQEAKDWVNGETVDISGSQYDKLTYIRDMEKGSKWMKYNEDVENREVSLELEYEIFTSLVEEMLLDCYL